MGISGAMRGMPARVKPWVAARRPVLVDVLVIVILELLTLASVRFADLSLAGALYAQPTILLLLWRRRHPVGVFAAAAVLELACLLFTFESGSFPALVVALYTVAAHRRRRVAFAAAVVFEAINVLTALHFSTPEAGFLTTLTVLNGLMLAGLFLGTTLYTQRQYAASLRDRAERLERERDQQALLAATAERTRIAREMHDIVAHSLSVVIRLADGAVATARTDPETASAAMGQVAATGRQSLAEMRRLLGVLREEPGGAAALAPQPDLQRIDVLLEEVRATGLPVALSTSGTPLALPAMAETTVYRIVQEGLTNVLRHAVRPTRVDVALAWRGEELEIAVRDDGASAPVTSRGAGQGLRGIGERAALYDGEVESGPLQPRGWQVRARLRFPDEAASVEGAT
jgi:signal transduction histidine kinase